MVLYIKGGTQAKSVWKQDPEDENGEWIIEEPL